MPFPLLKKLRTFWFSPYILTLPGTLLFIFLLPDIFNRYRVEIIKSGLIDKKDGFEYYADLNGDGNSERIVLFNNTEGKASIKILDYRDFIIEHFYFTGEIIHNPNSLVTGVFDISGQTGIFLMSKSNDSILLHGVCPCRKNEVLFRDQFITTISEQNGSHDYNIPSTLLYDIDRDGTKEIISGLMAGFQVQPRLLFIYNLRTDQMHKTPRMANYQGVCDTADINSDGFPELLVQSYAIGNNEDRMKLPYDDNCAWLMVYDRNLNFIFPPVKYPGKYIFLSPHPILFPGKPRIIVLSTTRVPGTGPPKLLLFNSFGKLLKERVLDDTLHVRNYNLIRSDEADKRIFLVRQSGIVEELDSVLKVVDRKQIEGISGTSVYRYDIDGDGRRELLFTGSSGSSFVITQSDFSYPVLVANPFDFGSLNFSVIRESGKPGSLFIQCGNRYITCSYERNPIYYMKYPVYLMIYLLVLGFIMVIRYLQRHALRQRYDAEKKIAEMQLLLLGNQMDPHFTFNVINAISASILQEKPEVANSNLLSLSRLMRSSVLQSDKLSRSLAEELDFLENYISLIHCRMNGSFQFKFDLSENVNLEWQVPKMITQIFVENAIKHGLKPLSKGGLLIIRIQRDGDNIILEIEDNGVGRKETITNGESGTGKGMSMIYQLITIINKFNQKKIRLTITDLEDEQGKSYGTLVHLAIPVGMNYWFYKK
jgi:two-component sensor histidine kinase